MKSKTLPIYTEWLKTATPAQVEFADSVYKMCEDNYDGGGDIVCETVSPDELEFKTLDEVRVFCGMIVAQEVEARCGNDSDPELKRSESFKKWV